MYSANPFERLKKEVKRRTIWAGVFLGEASVMRLMGAVTPEIAGKLEVG